MAEIVDAMPTVYRLKRNNSKNKAQKKNTEKNCQKLSRCFSIYGAIIRLLK